MLTSRSPRDVAIVALAAGKEAFSDYSHIYSPKKFTQPQLFACLVLKEFEKKDYRGIRQLLVDCPELQEVIGLTSVPHYTTLQKASRRLLRQDRVRVLLDTPCVASAVAKVGCSTPPSTHRDSTPVMPAATSSGVATIKKSRESGLKSESATGSTES